MIKWVAIGVHGHFGEGRIRTPDGVTLPCAALPGFCRLRSASIIKRFWRFRVFTVLRRSLCKHPALPPFDPVQEPTG